MEGSAEQGWAQLLLTDLETPLQLRPLHPPVRTLRGLWCVRGTGIGAPETLREAGIGRAETPRALATRGFPHVN